MRYCLINFFVMDLVAGLGDRLESPQGFFSFPLILNPHRDFLVEGFPIGGSQQRSPSSIKRSADFRNSYSFFPSTIPSHNSTRYLTQFFSVDNSTRCLLQFRRRAATNYCQIISNKNFTDLVPENSRNRFRDNIWARIIALIIIIK